MPRIRSIHPGFWTDEAVVSVTRDARLLFIGLWGQCDDGGVFEWKPLGLKMRIFPADHLNIEVLLEELVRAGLVVRFVVDHRVYGSVKNFLKYQRPKKPTFQFPTYDNSNLAGKSSEPVGNGSGKVLAETLRRRKEGGDSLEEIYPPSRAKTPPKKSNGQKKRVRARSRPRPPTDDRNAMNDITRELTREITDAQASDARDESAVVVVLARCA